MFSSLFFYISQQSIYNIYIGNKDQNLKAVPTEIQVTGQRTNKARIHPRAKPEIRPVEPSLAGIV